MRAIHPRTGSLGRLLDLCNEVFLVDAEFTVDRKKLDSWRIGRNPHVRQFAEIRGILMPDTLSTDLTSRVIFNPLMHNDFRLAATGDSLNCAEKVLIRASDRSIWVGHITHS